MTFAAACLAIGVGGGTVAVTNPDYSLQVSAQANAAFAVKPLVQLGATTEPKSFSTDPLYWASMKGSEETVRSLINAGFEVTAWHNVALITAASNGHVNVVSLLLSEGADINARGARGALMGAASAGHMDVVKLLIESGVNLHTSGELAITLAKTNNRHEVAAYISRHMPKKDRKPHL